MRLNTAYLNLSRQQMDSRIRTASAQLISCSLVRMQPEPASKHYYTRVFLSTFLQELLRSEVKKLKIISILSHQYENETFAPSQPVILLLHAAVQ